MDLLILLFLSMTVALVGFFNPISLSTVQLTYGLLERLKLGMDYLGEVLREASVPNFETIFRIYSKNLSSSMPYVAQLTATLSTLSEQLVCSKIDCPSQLADSLPEALYTPKVNNPEMNGLSSSPGLDEVSTRWLRQINLLDSNTDHGVSDFWGLYHGDFLLKKSTLVAALISVLMILTVTSILTWNNQRKCLQVANIEILGFINEVQAKKSFLLERVKLATSTLDDKINGISRQIATQYERLSTELSVFLGNEVNLLRKALELQFQGEVEHQISQMKLFTTELERTCRSIPDPAKIEAEYKGFQSKLQHSRERISNLIAHIDAVTVSCNNLEDTVKQIMMKQVQACVTKFDSQLMVDCRVINKPGHDSSTGDKEETGNKWQSTRFAQWRMATGHTMLTPEEIEEGRRIRRERVEMRLAAHGSGQNSERIKMTLKSRSFH